MYSIVIQGLRWETVVEIPQGTVLEKGRKNQWYQQITTSAANLVVPWGCCAWASKDVIYYIGSFRPYARKSYKSSLQGRVSNYLQNHRTKNGGYENTNLHIFNNINTVLQNQPMMPTHLTFDTMKIGARVIDFAMFSGESVFVHAVEQLLICTYRLDSECIWNRT